MIFRWLWEVVFIHGWWKRHPKEWEQIVKTKDKLTQKLIHYELLPERYAKMGAPIHKIKCKVCGDEWYTSCKLDLCRKLSCWLKYRRK